MTRKYLPRRTFLRGLGTSIALPMLDAMFPAFGAPARTAVAAPCRMVFAYVPNGVVMEDWTPDGEGAAFELKSIMEPMAPLRDRTLVFSGLTHNGGRALGDGPGDHARAAASYLTGAHPKKTAGADIRNGASVDQVAAQALGRKTPLASLELSCEDGRQAGNCDSGYSCAYSNNLSWISETTPAPPVVNPRVVFERLFGTDDAAGDPVARARQRRRRKSILDFVTDDTRQLQNGLGPSDRRKLDEYLSAVRAIEKQIEIAETQTGDFEPDVEKPAGIPLLYGDHVKLMLDLTAVAMQGDMTRIVTFMFAREGSNNTYREVGVSEAHHGLTHHMGDEEKIRKISAINRYHMELFAGFAQKLASTPDGDGTLLDHSMVVYGSGIADGNRHTHHDLPVLMVGGGGHGVKTGRHARYPTETPMTNLYLSMLVRMGLDPDSLGDSTGKLEGLYEV
ncbi:MAG: DUF1552 domain-containing protein [Bryobacteraceae bacterium]|nr:DUF1552 domain-containing protein [Bryobacteraceae bacterium]